MLLADIQDWLACPDICANFKKKLQGLQASYTGNWQILITNLPQRVKLLAELCKAKKTNEICRDFGIGIYKYLQNNSSGIAMPILDQELLEKIVNRFKPLFHLQYRILDLFLVSLDITLMRKRMRLVSFGRYYIA